MIIITNIIFEEGTAEAAARRGLQEERRKADP